VCSQASFALRRLPPQHHRLRCSAVALAPVEHCLPRELLAKAPPGPLPVLDVPQRICAACGKQQLQLLQCSRCKAAFYCDAACQKRHWREQKAACGAVAAASGT
jgi:hypothetical protein